ncbi:MAG: STAS domain-containing protein [Deltaproteobacteria bacterium]|nr:STAS domain-containing protein [Deltaproteobacteria bacterium]
MDHSLTFEERQQNGVTIIGLSGTLDAASAPQLKLKGDGLANENKFQLVVDLGALGMIDSSGVGALVGIGKRVRSMGGDLKFARPSGQPAEIFKLLRLDRAFEVFGNVDDAIKKFPPPRA